jgi:hypothetical protein
VRQRILRHQEGRPDVAADVLVELVNRRLVGFGADQQDAGVVDEHVEPCIFVERRLDTGASSCIIGDIAGERNRRSAIVQDGRNHVTDGIVSQAVHDHLGAFQGELAADGLADAGSAAGHNY